MLVSHAYLCGSLMIARAKGRYRGKPLLVRHWYSLQATAWNRTCLGEELVTREFIKQLNHSGNIESICEIFGPCNGGVGFARSKKT